MRKLFFYILCFFITTLSLSANTDVKLLDLENIATNSEDFTIWAALFGLGAVAIIALFLSSEKMKNFKKDIKDSQDTLSKMNQTQHQILSNMGEHIQNIAKETVDTAKKLAENDEKKDVSKELSKVVNSENKLLAITTNLIEFLRIKSKKIEILNENLKLSNILSDVSGTLKANTKELELELIYNINSNVPENLIGDPINISKVLINLILYGIENNARETEVSISKSNIFEKPENLYFSVKSDVKIDIENDETIFNSNYNEETNSYESLGLFIAKELSALMGGNLIAKNDKKGFIEFLFSIPFKEDKKIIKDANPLSSKRVLIIDSSNSSATAINNIFTELKHKTTKSTKEEYLLSPPNFADYDLVVIDEKLITDKTAQELQQTTAKVISLSNLFKIPKEFKNTKIADIELNKPLTRKQINETIQRLFLNKPEEIVTHKDIEIEKKTLLIHKRTFEDSKNVELNDFSKYRETKVLLVEDNLINQKVFIGVLSKSGMNITVANDGKEALDILHSEKKFDIVFMDVNMPIMDGYTATTIIREESRFDQLPVVALSALGSTSEVDKMFSCGMNGYLPKPLKKEKLFTVFTLFIDKISEDRRAKRRVEKNITELDGLNILFGLAQASSNEIFYKEILLEFKDAYGESDKVFEKLATDFRYEQLRMFCIDLKGLSGSIGAQDLHQLTTEVLQRLIYKKYDLIPSFVERYKKELNRINRSIDEYIS